MSGVLDYPVAVFAISLVSLLLSARVGALVADRLRPVREDEWDDLNLMSNASLTLLALIIGFSFSMAVTRYDLRKSNESEEANAIGTEYLRVDLLPAAEAARVRELLLQYVDLRVQFYELHESQRFSVLDSETTKLQAEMWKTVQGVASTQPTPTVALAVGGMNDVLNRQGYTQAAWWNRIPTGAWALLAGISVCCCVLVGYGAHRRKGMLFAILPFLISIAFGFIADIDSPRHGVIPVSPQNLVSLSRSLHGH